MQTEEQLEQTLHIAREVNIYRVPPRGPGGWKSAEWLVADEIFSGRLRVISRGEECEVRIEHNITDELFAVCPVPYGSRNACIEPVQDSSRYFVIRVEDPSTKRHAFLGMGFEKRADAFDFTEALVRHEKWVEREQASRALQASDAAPGGAAAVSNSSMSAGMQAASKDVQALYQQQGQLALAEGQTIHVAIKKPAGAGSGKLAGGLLAGSAGGTGLFVGGMLAPPPTDSGLAGRPAPAQAPAPAGDLLGWGAPAQQGGAIGAPGSAVPSAAAAAATSGVKAPHEDWAFFD